MKWGETLQVETLQVETLRGKTLRNVIQSAMLRE